MSQEKFDTILNHLPYTWPFLFVDGLTHVDENRIEGHYTFPEDSFFYEGHFKDNPVTPGVIITECMAQIGVVCLGIHNLILQGWNTMPPVAMTDSNVRYLLPVYPKEKIFIYADKQYFRFGKIKCDIKCINAAGMEVARGVISGVILERNVR